MDSIRKRYVTYAKQTQYQRDSTKTDFTYARSFSYTKYIDKRRQWEWDVPNMCRTSLTFFRSTTLLTIPLTGSFAPFITDDSALHLHKLKGKSFEELLVPDLNSEINENLINKLRDRQKSADLRKWVQKWILISILFLIFGFLLFLLSSQCIPSTSVNGLSDGMSKNAIKQLFEELKQIKYDLKALKDSNNELKLRIDGLVSPKNQMYSKSSSEPSVSMVKVENDMTGKPSNGMGNEGMSSIQYLALRCDGQLLHPKSRHGTIELLSIVANEGQNDFSCLYRFTETPNN